MELNELVQDDLMFNFILYSWLNYCITYFINFQIRIFTVKIIRTCFCLQSGTLTLSIILECILGYLPICISKWYLPIWIQPLGFRNNTPYVPKICSHPAKILHSYSLYRKQGCFLCIFTILYALSSWTYEENDYFIQDTTPLSLTYICIGSYGKFSSITFVEFVYCHSSGSKNGHLFVALNHSWVYIYLL